MMARAIDRQSPGGDARSVHRFGIGSGDRLGVRDQ